jgi:hypothetical protein
MAYTDGAVHQLAGTGVVTIAAPIGVRWHVSTRPTWLGSRPGQPLSIEGMGRFAFGDASSFGNDVQLTHVDQLVYPLVGGVTRMGYTLENGVAATLTELVEVPSATSKAPYDRNPQPAGQETTSWNPANTAQQTAWTFTVPAGRKLLLTRARVLHTRVANAPAASLNTGQGFIQIDGASPIVYAFFGYLVNTSRDDLSGALYLPAGSVLRGFYSNSETTGGVYTQLGWAGTLFDA